MGHPQAPLQFECGIRVVGSNLPDARQALNEIAGALAGEAVGFVLIYASSRYQADDVAAGLVERFPDIPFAGCTTSGEIGTLGITEASIVVMAFPASDFTIASALLPDLDHFGVEEGTRVVRRVLASFPDLGEGPVIAPDEDDESRDSLFALTLLDGLCKREEIVLATLQRALGDVPVIGGSAGDDLAFERTHIFYDGHAVTNAGVLLLIRTRHPVQLFKADNFEPTNLKFVVTECDAERRIVKELDAEVAALAYAEAMGIEANGLTPMSFAAHPVLVRVGGEYYCRSIQKLNPDGSLQFFCAIENGVVLTAGRARDLAASLEETLAGIEASLGGIDLVLGFDCVLRRLDAEHRQALRAMSDIYRRYRVFGFNTYGEQYKAMHLNQTFTGIAIGRSGGR